MRLLQNPPLGSRAMFARRKAAILTLLSWFVVGIIPFVAQAADVTTGLEGEIRIGPARGGPAQLGVSNTMPLIKTTFVVKQKEKIVASFETDDKGRFQLSLAPGKYHVSKKDWNGRFGSYGPFEVEIVAGQIKKVEWECDSGMQ
jgi:hypothetical protein